MNNLKKLYKWVNSKDNKVLKYININNKVFKNLYHLKDTLWLEYLTYHISDKIKITKQFEKNKDLIFFLKDKLPKGNILYIDYIEVNSNKRSNWIGSKIIKKIIETSKKIWLNGIYLDSYEWSINFWEKNWFLIDQDKQEEKDWEYSDYHSGFLIL